MTVVAGGTCLARAMSRSYLETKSGHGDRGDRVDVAHSFGGWVHVTPSWQRRCIALSRQPSKNAGTRVRPGPSKPYQPKQPAPSYANE